ncbi:MAG: hypothetical protein R3E87_05415 [Burkholderiaceae bacterium]
MSADADICSLGRPTFHARVEAWQCDHNDHWNVRNYMRCFDQASHVVAGIAGTALATEGGLAQHTRYHRELLLTAAVEVRSAVLADGDHAGAMVHLLSSGGRLSATALLQPGLVTDVLPRVSADAVRPALPRGVDGRPHAMAAVAAAGDAQVIEHGFVQPHELDHTGSIAIDCLMGRVAAATNFLLHGIGFDPDFMKAHGLTRMGVETKFTRFGRVPAGTRLGSQVWVASGGARYVVLRHRLFEFGGPVVAAVDQSLVIVDLATRRATDVPSILRDAETGTAQ